MQLGGLRRLLVESGPFCLLKHPPQILNSAKLQDLRNHNLVAQERLAVQHEAALWADHLPASV